jgi:uncharacterized damage-inducible protein DinB
MNADAFRYLYAYHFTENRTIWEKYILPLPQEQFIQSVPYSVGSVRNQIIHLMNVDHAWFCQLRGVEPEPWLNPVDFTDRTQIRARWDHIEHLMREYLSTLRDDMLLQKPFPEGEDQDLILWQVLIHGVNHGTDHRAQLLRILHDLGIRTVAQDFVFYAYDHP